MAWPFRKKNPIANTSSKTHRVAVIDIGSNSIRLVVYDGPRRVPALIFNEKVMAGLGSKLDETGAIGDESMAVGMKALARFRQLCTLMEVDEIRCVATAAVRVASNGNEFISKAEKHGFSVEVLSGEQEAELAGLGVVSAIPEADGIVGDLGGGSLELVRIKNGEMSDRISLPLGVLRIAAMRANSDEDVEKYVSNLLKKSGWDEGKAGLPLYLVGGSWRGLARLDMHLSGYPLPVIHHYTMPAERSAELRGIVSGLDRAGFKAVQGLSNSRITTMDDAALLLDLTVKFLKTTKLIASAYGLREGLIYQNLTQEQRQSDPLILATEEAGAAQARFPANSRLLGAWIENIFADDSEAMARLRRAACNLGDVAWRANPDFRAERGLEMARHGNWVGIDGAGREIVGQAVFTSFGGGQQLFPDSGKLADRSDMHRAVCWGLAMRLGQRLSAGTREPLEHSKLCVEEGKLKLILSGPSAQLQGDSVKRRLNQLAAALELEPFIGS